MPIPCIGGELQHDGDGLLLVSFFKSYTAPMDMDGGTHHLISGPLPRAKGASTTGIVHLRGRTYLLLPAVARAHKAPRGTQRPLP